MKLFKFIFKTLTTVIIGVIIGWYMANTNLPMKIKLEFVNPIIKSSRILSIKDNIYK